MEANQTNVDHGAHGTQFTAEEVKPWVDAMAKRGIYGIESARLRISALTQIVSVLGPEEASDVSFLLSHVDDLGRRFARLKMAKPETVNTYVTRVRQTLADFLRYQTDPTGFKVTGASGTQKSSKDAPKRKGSASKDKPSTATEPTGNESQQVDFTGPLPTIKATQGRPQWRTFPLDADGQELIYALPQGGIMMRDVMKFIYHLATLAKDFDPFNNPKQAQVFALVRNASE
ncbi:MAG: hypothetical protein JNJ46_01520 [Myxococcales bacterium]|nr:hypothetical protein [Myxococcales bacterium]